MKKPYNELFLTIISFTLLSPFSLYGDIITLRADEWCPYNCDPKSNSPGFMVEVAKEIFEKQGHKVDYQTLNYKRTLRLVREGSIDGVIGAIPEEAEDFIYPKEEQAANTDYFWVKKEEKWNFSSLKELISTLQSRKSKLGYKRGYEYDDSLNAFIDSEIKRSKSLRLVHPTGGKNDPLPQLLRMVAKGKLLTFIEDKYVVLYHLRKNNYLDRNRKRVDYRIAGAIDPETYPLYIAFSPRKDKNKSTKTLEDSKRYAKILSEGIIQLRRSCKLQKILKKYGLKDWKKMEIPICKK